VSARAGSLADDDGDGAAGAIDAEEDTMSEPARPGPVPSTLRPTPTGQPAGPAAENWRGLAARPIADHVAVFEAELDRLQRELSAIDLL
jgi:hypothetical protein